MRSFIQNLTLIHYLGFICLKFPDLFVNNFVFALTLMLKICFSYGTFKTSTYFPNRGVVNICLDLIGQKAFFLTLLDKCSSRSKVFTMKLIPVS